MKTLHELAWEVPDDLICDTLIDVMDNGNYGYCAAGWMLHEIGMNDDDIINLNEEPSTVVNYVIAAKFGITIDQLTEIYSANDRLYDPRDQTNDSVERKLAVRRVLLELAGA